MEVKLYNSLSNKLETFVPIKPGEVSIYVCGPTVYNDPHIGNMRPPVVFDTLRRFFEAIGYNVKFVSNYTDVDDKIINKAIEEGVDEKTISERYISRYRECLDRLNIEKAYENPRVTQYMFPIINYISGLVDKKAAYVVDGEVFFDVHSVPNYGILSNTKIDDLVSGARVEENDKKRSPLDFLLWKKTDKGIKWQTKWCLGRPGWHTECCVMIDTIFGGKIDIHGGGNDLKFPHHENEIAQAEAMHGNTLANYRVHNAMMNINGDKMSKSLGNVILAKDAIDKYGADTLRLFLENAPYRSIINLSDETIEDTRAILQKITSCYTQLNTYLNLKGSSLEGKSRKIEPFLEALADDLNVPNAVTYLLEVLKEANFELRKKDKDDATISDLFYAITEMVHVLGLYIAPKKLTEDDVELYNNYIEAKEAKNFVESDALRKELIERGIM
jgi:cysteinyl-tRNA synthetase